MTKPALFMLLVALQPLAAAPASAPAPASAAAGVPARGAVPAVAPAPQSATVPDVQPVFSNPTRIANPYVVFDPGTTKVFSGRADGVRTTTVITHLEETRTFRWQGGLVSCAIVKQVEFDDGGLVEIAYDFLAQDDAGNVRSFGELSLLFVDGAPAGAEQDSWLVGGPALPGDPPGAHAVAEPTLYMPATPVLGQSFQVKQLPGYTETLTVVATQLAVTVPAGKFAQVIQLQELDDGEDGNPPGPPGHWWLAPGVGVVREQAVGVMSRLVATSQQPLDAGPDRAAPADR